jgi:hypothetical protein
VLQIILSRLEIEVAVSTLHASIDILSRVVHIIVIRENDDDDANTLAAFENMN